MRSNAAHSVGTIAQMPRISRLLFFSFSLTCAVAALARAEPPMDLLRADRSLLEAPHYAPSDAAKFPTTAPSVRAIFYDTKSWHGQPTKTFAWLGVPAHAANEKLPAIVLVHGGGGTAFDQWVKLWNDRGYAAIAMDLCGCVPLRVEGTKTWQRHDAGGPAGWDASFAQADEPLADQWPYHAICDVMLAHSLLRSLPDVDADRIGLTGISWGGYLACMVPAVDNRFRFSVPVYGCGFIDECTWAPTLEKMPPASRQRWLDAWDPKHWLSDVTMPTLWVDGTNDTNYPLGPLMKSYRLTSGERALCLTPRMRHGHGPGQTPEVIRAYADALLKDGPPLPKITGFGRDGERAWATFDARAKVTKAELHYTLDTGDWPKREWKAAAAEVSRDRATARLPAGTRAYFINLIDDRGVAVSTEVEEVQ